MPFSDKASKGNILGIDLGTSGIRAVIVSPHNKVLQSAQIEMPFPSRKGSVSEQQVTVWQTALVTLLDKIRVTDDFLRVKHIVADATSSTVLMVNSQLNALTPALMYDDKRANTEASLIETCALPNAAATGASSTLAKVLWLESHLRQSKKDEPCFICHQIDWLNQFFLQSLCPTDANNALKLGYDVVHQVWPQWVSDLVKSDLPEVVMPGTVIGDISSAVAKRFDFDVDTKIYAGTTDSIAAFLASGANQIGEATTSLGSTLSLKLLTDTPVFSPEHGVYSHLLKNKWLVGGASNTGGAVLLKYFSLDEIRTLLNDIDINYSANLSYYPLVSIGERFPIADSEMEAKVSPRPEADSVFLQALIEGLVSVEKLGYEVLEALTGTQVTRVFAAGGGTKNPVWMGLREKTLGYETKKAAQIDAAFGVTQLLLD